MTTTPTIESRLAQLAVDTGDLARLHRRLEAAAEQDGVLDIAYTTVATPVGDLLLAATTDGLLRVAFDCEGHDAVLAALAEQVSPRVLRSPARLEPVVREVEEYFAGQRTGFDLRLDLRLSTGFRRSVLAHLREVAYGATTTYAALAAAAGSPRAVRAAGSACATNPLPVVVPCHRVLRSDGHVGQYLGGVQAKERLLALERGAA